MKDLRNYLIVGIIAAVTIYFTFYFANFYIANKEKEDEINNLLSTLSEINTDEFDNFVVENDSMVYIADKTISNEKVQKKVMKVLNKNGYLKNVVFLNMDKLDESFYTKLFERYYLLNIDNTSIVSDSLLIIKEGKIVAIMNITDSNVKNLKKFITTNYGE